MELISRVAAIIEREALLRPEQRVVVAVSGGPDSLCLAHVLRALGYRLHIAHLDHGLRPESGQEANYVDQLAQDWGVARTIERADPKSTSAGSQEEWARGVRYSFLLRVANKTQCQTVATGHTADDQVETLLMSLLRGAGPRGLAGMPYRGSLPIEEAAEDNIRIQLIRPLLEVWRGETHEYCRQAGLTARRDPSNLDQAFTRNRVRHQLLPALAEFNPAVKDTLLRTGWLMRSVSDWLEEEANLRWGQVVQELEKGGLELDRDGLRSLPAILGTTILRKAHRSLAGSKVELGFDQTNTAYDLICEHETNRKMMLPGGVHLQAAGSRVWLSRDPAALISDRVPQISASVQLAPEGETDLADGWKIRAQRVSIGDDLRRQILAGRTPFDSSYLEVLAQEYLQGPLQLRAALPGDSFQPLGMQGSMKVSDFFINEGIPREQRPRWPLLTMGDQILWIVGLRLDHNARIRGGSNQGLRLEIIPPD